MKIFSATYSDIIKFDRKPNEDFYLISKAHRWAIFALADGVTQVHFKSGGYSYPAGAKVAAQIFCYSTVELIEKNFKPNQKIIERAFDFANGRIFELNKNEGISKRLDYLVYDYFDAVGVVGFIIKNTLYYGYVGDSGLVIFDKNDNLRFQTEDMVKPAEERAKTLYKNWNKLSETQKAKIFHQEFRNNLSGEGYGSFTGEKGVKKYYKIGQITLKAKDLIVFYSDGFVKYLKFPEFIKILKKQDKKALDNFTYKKAKENYEKFGKDRTLISLTKD